MFTSRSSGQVTITLIAVHGSKPLLFVLYRLVEASQESSIHFESFNMRDFLAVWDLRTLVLLGKFPIVGGFHMLALNTTLAIAGYDCITLHKFPSIGYGDGSEGRVAFADITGSSSNTVTAMIALPDGIQICVAVRHFILVVDSESGACTAKIVSKHSGAINCMSVFGPEGCYHFVTVGSDGIINLWNQNEAMFVACLNNKDAPLPNLVGAVGVSPDGWYFVTGDSKGRLTLWSVAGTTALATTVQSQLFPISRIHFVSNDVFLVFGVGEMQQWKIHAESTQSRVLKLVWRNGAALCAEGCRIDEAQHLNSFYASMLRQKGATGESSSDDLSVPVQAQAGAGIARAVAAYQLTASATSSDADAVNTGTLPAASPAPTPSTGRGIATVGTDRGQFSSVVFHSMVTRGDYTYEVYRAPHLEIAEEFLKIKNVVEDCYYIEVETPAGTLGTDNTGDIYPVAGGNNENADESSDDDAEYDPEGDEEDLPVLPPQLQALTNRAMIIHPDRLLDELLERDGPGRQLGARIFNDYGIPGVQAAHLYLSVLDPERATLLSGLWGQYLLRADDHNHESAGYSQEYEEEDEDDGLDTDVLNEFVEELLRVSETDMQAEVSRKHPGSTCRRIGIRINEAYGKSGLVFVCDAVRARYRMKAVYLEYIWDGIGTFQR